MNGEQIDIITPTREPFIAQVVARVPALHQRAEADAQLIAAAPELLLALKAAWLFFDSPSNEHQLLREVIGAALEKAEGQS
jgi:hypothetical protein